MRVSLDRARAPKRYRFDTLTSNSLNGHQCALALKEMCPRINDVKAVESVGGWFDPKELCLYLKVEEQFEGWACRFNSRFEQTFKESSS